MNITRRTTSAARAMVGLGLVVLGVTGLRIPPAELTSTELSRVHSIQGSQTAHK